MTPQELLKRLNGFQANLPIFEKYSDAWWAASRAIDSIVRQLDTKYGLDAVLIPSTNLWIL